MRSIFLFAILIASFSACRKLDSAEEKTFFNAFNSAATIAKQTSDEGIIALTREGGSSVVYRISNEGFKLWNKDLSGIFASYANLSITCLAPATDGRCVLAGNFSIAPISADQSALLLITLSPEGEIISQHTTDTLMTESAEFIYDITPSNDGGWAALAGKQLIDSSYLFMFNRDGILTRRNEAVKADYWKKS